MVKGTAVKDVKVFKVLKDLNVVPLYLNYFYL